MAWNWEQHDWPNFRYDASSLAPTTREFFRRAGELSGVAEHLESAERAGLRAELLSDEAIQSAAIEGEVLERASVRSSLRRHFGLDGSTTRGGAAERGMAALMATLHDEWDCELTDARLFEWQRLVVEGQRGARVAAGRYREDGDPMQIISGPVYAPRVHFVAPPAVHVPAEMKAFLAFFEQTRGDPSFDPVARAGIAHLYFVSIHPFEDGNGRVGRAIAECALSQTLGHASLTGLSSVIAQRRSDYYDALERASRDNEVTEWLRYFSDVVLAGQARSLRFVRFLVEKTRFLDRLRSALNPRQEKALLRILREGPDGFQGGLSAGNYMTITGAPPATARRDLGALVELGALRRTGEKRGTRYWLTLE